LRFPRAFSTRASAGRSREEYLFDSLSDFGRTRRSVFSNLGTAAPRGKNLGGIQKPVGIEHTLDEHHGIQVALSEHKAHEILLFVTDTVLSAQ
jgi:hypothetical protein